MGHGLLFYCTLTALAMLWSLAGGATSYVIGVLHDVDRRQVPFQQAFDRYKCIAAVVSGLYMGTAASLVCFVLLGYALASHLSLPDITILSVIGGSPMSLLGLQIYRRLGRRWPAVFLHSEEMIQAQLRQGHIKLELCRRLGDDWMNLADWFGVLPADRARWEQGREPHRLWVWLENRGRLKELAYGLKGIGREDLADLLF